MPTCTRHVSNSLINSGTVQYCKSVVTSIRLADRKWNDIVKRLIINMESESLKGKKIKTTKSNSAVKHNFLHGSSASIRNHVVTLVYCWSQCWFKCFYLHKIKVFVFFLTAAGPGSWDFNSELIWLPPPSLLSPPIFGTFFRSARPGLWGAGCEIKWIKWNLAWFALGRQRECAHVSAYEEACLRNGSGGGLLGAHQKHAASTAAPR